MFRRLREKWSVSGWRLLLILCTFAIGGSLSGWAARKLLAATGLPHGAGWIALYIAAVTILWPLCVLLISIPLGQFGFFRHYLARLGRKISGSNKESVGLHPTSQRLTKKESESATVD